MRLVLLTALSAEGEVQHRYVAHALAETFSDELKAIIVANVATAPLLKRARRYWRRYTVPQLLSRTLIKIRHRVQKRHERQQATYRRILFPAGDDGKMPRRDLIRVVPSHNGKTCLDILQELNPDIIAVYGTVLIRGGIIANAKRSILNMHTGLSPRYRGSDTIFWPLYNCEPEWVGVTIHRLDLGVDAGPILATAKPEISANDDEDILFAKCVKVGCEHFRRAIWAEYNGKVDAAPQTLGDGREYRSVERTVSAERRVERLLEDGLLRRYVSRCESL